MNFCILDILWTIFSKSDNRLIPTDYLQKPIFPKQPHLYCSAWAIWFWKDAGAHKPVILYGLWAWMLIVLLSKPYGVHFWGGRCYFQLPAFLSWNIFTQESYYIARVVLSSSFEYRGGDNVALLPPPTYMARLRGTHRHPPADSTASPFQCLSFGTT